VSTLSLHAVESVTLDDIEVYPSGGPSGGFCSRALVVRLQGGRSFRVDLFADGPGPLTLPLEETVNGFFVDAID
jgi:hypothetical protein